MNALVAWAHPGSPHHTAFHRWAVEAGLKNLRTCAHAELGFIRVSMQVFRYSLPQAQAAADKLRNAAGGFVDSAPPPRLPAWADRPARTSDGYLAQLAAKNGLALATFDAGIPDATLIA